MEAKTLKNSKLVQDSRIEYFNTKLEKLEKRAKKVYSLMWDEDSSVSYKIEEWEMLSVEREDLDIQIRETQNYISENNLHRYDEIVIISTDNGFLSSYDVEGLNATFSRSYDVEGGNDEFSLKLTPSSTAMHSCRETRTKFSNNIEL